MGSAMRAAFNVVPKVFAFHSQITLIQRKTLWSGQLMATFASYYYYLSLPDKPVYLQSWNGKKVISVAGVECGRSVSARFNTLYIIDAPPFESSGDTGNDYYRQKMYVRSCLSSQSLFRQFLEEEELSSSFEFVLGARTCDGGFTRRQLYALLADDAPRTADDALRLHAKKHDCGVWVFERDAATSESSPLWRLRDRQTTGNVRQMSEVLEICDKPLQVSPIFQERCFSPVFHDFERTIHILDMYKECPEVQQLRQIAAKELREQRSLSQLVSLMKNPLVVVEGMDAIGKTTLTEFLEEKLEAARYSTPPPCLLPLRRFFDKLPEIVRRAYYSLGNYIVAQQIAAECQTRPVVMDRYWHSTAAYSIANETSYEDLPPSGHHDYCWPTDLLKPTAVIFLTVSEDVRRERLGHRQVAITFEEKSLNKDQLFRKRLCEAYLRMQEPACVQVDASGSKEEVVEAVLKQLKLQGVHLT